MAPNQPCSGPKLNAYGAFPFVKTVQYEDIEFPLDLVHQLLPQQHLMNQLPEIHKKKSSKKLQSHIRIEFHISLPLENKSDTMQLVHKRHKNKTPCIALPKHDCSVRP